MYASRVVPLVFVLFGLLIGTEHSFAGGGPKVYEAVTHAVVVLEARDSYGRTISQGSGVIIGRAFVATNCHVISNAARIVVYQYIETDRGARLLDFDADHWKGDKRYDLCIVRTDHSLYFSAEVVPVRIGVATDHPVGSDVYAIGAPTSYHNTITDGLISQFRHCRVSRYLEACPSDAIIQTNVGISGGSSGGGLFNGNAELIGITTYTDTKSSHVSFAIPADWIKKLVNYEKRLAENAVIYGKVGRIREAIDIAKEIDNIWKRARTLLRIASSLAKWSDSFGANILLKEAKAISRKLDDPFKRASLFRRIAVLQLELGENAADTIKEAWDSVTKISEPEAKATALVRMSYVEALAGNCLGAGTALTDAKKVKLNRDISRKRVENLIPYAVSRIKKNVSGCKVL